MGSGSRLGRSFFDRSVHRVAVELLGCELLIDGVGGTIVETESYAPDDPACHSYRGRTERNRPMFGPPGHAYVYLSYGVHTMLNVVCEEAGSAAAVLVRALEPKQGLERMRARRGRDSLLELCSGPGKLAQALGVGLELSGASLLGAPFELSAASAAPPHLRAPRVGISQAVELPWRNCVTGSRFVSRPRPWPAA